MNALMGHWDRQETPEQMEAASRVLMLARERFRALAEPTSPKAGSMLALENAGTAFDPIGDQVVRHRARATDSLEMLLDAMIDDEKGTMSARPMAMYALIRMSIEASGVAQWTIQSSRKADRIFRSLQVAYVHLRELADLAGVVSADDRARPYREFREEKEARLESLKDSVAVLRQRELKGPPKLWQIMSSVSPTRRPREPHAVDSPYVVWKICSAFLHGSDHITRLLGDVRQLSTSEDGRSAEFEMTPSWQLLCSCVLVCVTELERLDARHRYLASHNYANREVPG